MANFIIDPNMGFLNGVPGQDPGPDYATNQFNTNTTIGSHDHSAGKGVLIGPNGLNINADLPINSNNLVSVKTVNFTSQSVPLAGSAPNLGCIYVAGNELYYNDEVGNQVAITNSGSVNAGAGSITGLPSGTASASYSSGSQTFIWRSATLTPANMDGGSFIFRDISASSKGVTVSAPPALGADLQLFWPSVLPGSTNFLTLDSSGNIGTVGDITDESTLTQSGQTLSIKPQGVTQNLLAPRSTGTTVGAGGIAISITTGLVSKSTTSYSTIDDGSTNLSITITTTGRPVWVGFMPTMGSDSQSVIQLQNTGGSNLGCTAFLAFLRNASIIASHNLEMIVANITGNTPTDLIGIPPTSFYCLDMVAAGTYTYTAQAKVGSTAAMVITFNNMQLVAYEI